MKKFDKWNKTRKTLLVTLKVIWYVSLYIANVYRVALQEPVQRLISALEGTYGKEKE